MSIPYLVHKEDADRYDARELSMEAFRKELEEFEKTCDGPYRIWYEKYCKFRKEQEVKSNPVWESFGTIKIVTAFCSKPNDLENYYTYYRGYRWGEAKNCRMMKIATDGIESCNNAIKGKKVNFFRKLIEYLINF